MKHDKNLFGCKTDVISVNGSSIEIFRYHHTVFTYWMHEIEIQKIAAFSDIQFFTKNLLFFCCSVCKYSIRKTFNGIVSYVMENELIENVIHTLRGLFWVLFEEDKGKFTTFVVLQELQMVRILSHV